MTYCHVWNDPEHLTYFEYNEDGDIVGYRGAEVNDYAECPKHGFYPTTYANGCEIRCKCPKCLAEELFEKRLRGAMIPRRFMNRSINNFEAVEDWQINAFTKIKDYIDNLKDNLEMGKCIVMCGGVGTGKTHLAVSVAHEAMAQGKTAVYTTVSNLILKIRDTWGTGKTMEMVDTFASADLLILDEVGVQAGTENEKNILFDVLNARYSDMKATIVLSNLTQSDVAKYLGLRVWDRLKENGGFSISLVGNSYRKTVKQAVNNGFVGRRMQVPEGARLATEKKDELDENFVF